MACIALLTWTFWPARPAGADTGSLVPKLLCSGCGLLADVSQVKLEGDAARAPAMGPGYKCPKCQKRSLYPNPYICSKCKTPFLLGKDKSGEFSSKCPKCGTAN